MTFTVPTVWLAGFLLALARAGAWAVVAPPFNSSMIPGRVRVALAVGLSMVVAKDVPTPPVLGSGEFLAALVLQVVLGVILGFLVYLLLAAVEAAGQMLDLIAGFGMAQMYDPFSNASTAPLGRLYSLLSTVLIFVLDGHVLIVKGFLASYRAVPLGAIGSQTVLDLISRGIGGLLVSAIQIALPVAAALFLAEVALALISRAAPRIDVLVLGLGTKALIIMFLTGMALPLVPHALRLLLDRALHVQVLGG